MISYLCSKKHDFYSSKYKIDLIRNYSTADLYLELEIYEEEIYNLGVAKVTNEKLKNFLLGFLDSSLSDPLHMSLSVLNRHLLSPYIKKQIYKTYPCELKKDKEKIISFKLDVYIPDENNKRSGAIRDDIVFIVKHPVIRGELFKEIMEKVKKYVILVRANVAEYGDELEINFLELFDIFFEEMVKGKNLFLFINEITELRFTASHCEVHSPYHKSIRIVFRGTTAPSYKDYPIGVYIYDNKDEILKLDPEVLADYFLKKIMELEKDNPLIKRNYLFITGNIRETIKYYMPIFLKRMAFEIFVKYIYETDFHEFINNKVFKKINYNTSPSKIENFSTIKYEITSAFIFKELYKSKNFIHRFFTILLQNSNFGKNVYQYSGEKIDFFANNYGFSIYYDSYTIFSVDIRYDARHDILYLNWYEILVNPHERIKLLNQEEVRKDFSEIAKYFGVDTRIYGFIEKMIISSFISPYL